MKLEKLRKYMRGEHFLKIQSMNNCATKERIAYVYFLGNRKSKMVKIGHTKNILSRIVFIQTYCPFELDAFHLEYGDKAKEEEFHQRFIEYHEYGEWFRIEGELKRFLDRGRILKG